MENINEDEELKPIEWWYEVNGQQTGPVKENEIKKMLADNVLTPKSFVWKKGQEKWTPISETTLMDILSSDMPPPFIPSITVVTPPPLPKPQKQEPVVQSAPDNKINLGAFDKYYQEEFRKIHESNEQYKGSWNWYAFLFSSLWCLYKGCWFFAVVIIVTMGVTYRSSFYGILGLTWMLVMGFRGTWILYNVKIKNKQF